MFNWPLCHTASSLITAKRAHLTSTCTSTQSGIEQAHTRKRSYLTHQTEKDIIVTLLQIPDMPHIDNLQRLHCNSIYVGILLELVSEIYKNKHPVVRKDACWIYIGQTASSKHGLCSGCVAGNWTDKHFSLAAIANTVDVIKDQVLLSSS